MQARTYNPTTGRFLQTDNVQPNAPSTPGYSLYTYANNNPSTFNDPTGQTAVSERSIEQTIVANPKTRGGLAGFGGCVAGVITTTTTNVYLSPNSRISFIIAGGFAVATLAKSHALSAVAGYVVCAKITSLIIEAVSGYEPKPLPNDWPPTDDDDPLCKESANLTAPLFLRDIQMEFWRLRYDPAAAADLLSAEQLAATKAKPWLKRANFGNALQAAARQKTAGYLNFIGSAVNFADFQDRSYPNCYYELTTDNPGTIDNHVRRIPPGAWVYIASYPCLPSNWSFP